MLNHLTKLVQRGVITEHEAKIKVGMAPARTLSLKNRVALALYLDNNRKTLATKLVDAMCGMFTNQKILETYMGGGDEERCLDRLMDRGFSFKQAKAFLCME